ncbi:MAG: hypothetical protein AAGH89_01685 [Verrucomicrobiota bacterium]
MRKLLVFTSITLLAGCQLLRQTPVGEFSNKAGTSAFLLDTSVHQRSDQLSWNTGSQPANSAEARLTVGGISKAAVGDAEWMALSKLSRNPSLEWAKIILVSRTTNETWHVSSLREGPSLESVAQPFEVVSIVHTRAFTTGYAKEDRRVAVRLYPDGRVEPLR